MPVDVDPTEIHSDDLDDEWVVEEAGRSLKLRYLTGGLLALILLAGGFWGGVVAEKHHGTGTSAASSLASRFAALRGAGAGTGRTGTGTGGTGGFAGLGGGGFGGAGATTGTVINVSGDTIDITDSSGNLVKIQVPASATVTRTTKSALSQLQIGDTVVVTGAAGSGGTISATAVRASAQGVTAGGFGGGAGAGVGTPSG